MVPLLEYWDREMASSDERALAAAANRASGVRSLVEQSDADQTAALA
jgi:hypothetical protein